MHKIWIALLLLSFPVLGLAKTLNQVNLQATASATTANDEMTVELAFDKQGPKISTLVDQSSRAIHSALARINHFPKIHVASGVYNTYPIYSTPPAGSAPSFQGWRLHQTLILHSSDFQAMQTLLGQLQPLLTLSWVHFGLAPTTRHHLTDSVTQSAIKAFRHRALLIARSFDAHGYVIGQLTINNGVEQYPMPVSGMIFAKKSATGPLFRPGQNRVSVTVRGSIVLNGMPALHIP